ncbi:MAG: tyrosine-type recombinase/integrase [Candidatus Paceibacteria bacterium]
MSKITKLKQEFLQYQRDEKGRTKKTIKNYDLYLERFIDWFNQSRPSKITQETASQYKQWLSNYRDEYGEKIKPNTQNYHLIALRSFLRYLKELEINTISPSKIELNDIPDKEMVFLDKKDIKHLLKSPKLKKEDSKTKQKRKLRDKAILELLISNGLKVSQLQKIKKENISGKTFHPPNHQANKLPLSANTKDKIEDYLSSRSDSNPYLFISHDNRSESKNSPEFKGISPRSVQRLVKKHAKSIGLSMQATPNVLRNSCILHLLSIIDNLTSAQRYLNHKTITTTRHYKHLAGKKIDQDQSIFNDMYKDIVDKIAKKP